MKMGYSKERVLQACSEVSKTSGNKDTGSPWLSILCRLREDEVYGSGSQTTRKECSTISTPSDANGKH